MSMDFSDMPDAAEMAEGLGKMLEMFDFSKMDDKQKEEVLKGVKMSMMIMPVDKAMKEKWIDDLKSGQFSNDELRS